MPSLIVQMPIINVLSAHWSLFFDCLSPVTGHLSFLFVTDHPTSLCELRRASWLPTYAEAPAGKLVTGFHHLPLDTHSSTLFPPTHPTLTARHVSSVPSTRPKSAARKIPRPKTKTRLSRVRWFYCSLPIPARSHISYHLIS